MTERRQVKIGTQEMVLSAPYTNRKGEQRISLSGRAMIYGVEAAISITMPATAKIPTLPGQPETRTSGTTSNTRKAKVTRLPDAKAEGSRG